MKTASDCNFLDRAKEIGRLCAQAEGYEATGEQMKAAQAHYDCGQVCAAACDISAAAECYRRAAHCLMVHCGMIEKAPGMHPEGEAEK